MEGERTSSPSGMYHVVHTLTGEDTGEGDIKLPENLIQIAKKLRKKSTHTERSLWRHLKAKQLEGYKFRRQEVIGNYIVDFVCFEKRIVIEVDGSQHQAERNKDRKRDQWLKRQGFRVLRFWNNEVLNNMGGVYQVIKDSCIFHPPPAPSHQGRGKRVSSPLRGEE